MQFRGCSNGGFEFDTAGNIRGTPQMQDFYRHLRDPISDLSMLIDSEKATVCGCLHEVRIAKTYGTRDAMVADSLSYLGPSPKTIAALCKEKDRLCNSVCAHRDLDFRADPLGPVLEQFDKLRMLERTSWQNWHTMMSQTIQTIDRGVQSQRFGVKEDAERAVIVGQERQQELIRDIEGMQNVLRRCVATALAWIDRCNKK